MGGVTVRVPFAVPPEVAFDYLADPRHRPAWQSSLRDVEMLDDGPPRLGMRWRDRTAVGARPDLRITRFERPHHWSEVGTWRGITAELDLAFTHHGDATMVTADVRIDGTGRWVFATAVLARLAPLGIRSDLRRAAHLVVAAEA